MRLRYVSQHRLQQAGSQAEMALAALFYLGKNGLTGQVADKIANSLSVEEFSKLIARKMPDQMQSGLASSVRELTAR